MTLQEVFDLFMESRRLAGLSPKTLYAYSSFVLPFVVSAGADRPFSSLCQDDVSAYVSSVLDRPLSKASRATYIRHVKIFLRWAACHYPAGYRYNLIRVPKSPRREVRIYTDEEVKMIFAAVETDTEWITVRNKCIIALMYDSGLRQSEVCFLRRSDVSFSGNRMTVYGKGDRERIVPLGLFTRSLLERYFSLCPHAVYPGGIVFYGRRGEALTPNSVKLFMSRLADKLPFEISSHKLRHNFATNYCIDQYDRCGRVDIYRLMYLMGHEDVETTRRYLHFAYEVIACRDSVSRLDKLDGLCRSDF